MARLKQQTVGEDARLEELRQAELSEIREKAERMAAILARTTEPKARYQELLHAGFGLTAAQQAEWGTFDDVELIAQTVDHYAIWFHKDGPSWIREHYQASAAEVRQIAREELDRAHEKGRR